MRKENFEHGKDLQKRLENIVNMKNRDYCLRSMNSGTPVTDLSRQNGGTDEILANDLKNINAVVKILLNKAFDDCQKRLEDEFEEL